MKRQNLRTVSLIVVTLTYLLIGAAIFGHLEGDAEARNREVYSSLEWALRRKYNISDDDYENMVAIAIKSVPLKAGVQWKFSGAFYFATTVVTTIGYGHSTPSTIQGRSFCMVYALIGIPLGLVMFQSIGERLNTFVGSALRYAKRCFNARNPEVTQTNLVMVVSVLSTILMTSMAAVFARYERWDYFDAVYYCFITLTTIGFGDYVALQKDAALQSKPEYVALSLIFILFGLSVVSSAVNLLVLKFLTLNTEDERRDEQLRYTAAMNPIQLEGDVITSPAGKLEYARTKRPALTMSQAIARSSMGRDRRAVADAKLARSLRKATAATSGGDPPALMEPPPPLAIVASKHSEVIKGGGGDAPDDDCDELRCDDSGEPEKSGRRTASTRTGARLRRRRRVSSAGALATTTPPPPPEDVDDNWRHELCPETRSWHHRSRSHNFSGCRPGDFDKNGDLESRDYEEEATTSDDGGDLAGESEQAHLCGRRRQQPLYASNDCHHQPPSQKSADANLPNANDYLHHCHAGACNYRTHDRRHRGFNNRHTQFYQNPYEQQQQHQLASTSKSSSFRSSRTHTGQHMTTRQILARNIFDYEQQYQSQQQPASITCRHCQAALLSSPVPNSITTSSSRAPSLCHHHHHNQRACLSSQIISPSLVPPHHWPVTPHHQATQEQQSQPCDEFLSYGQNPSRYAAHLSFHGQPTLQTLIPLEAPSVQSNVRTNKQPPSSLQPDDDDENVFHDNERDDDDDDNDDDDQEDEEEEEDENKDDNDDDDGDNQGALGELTMSARSLGNQHTKQSRRLPLAEEQLFTCDLSAAAHNQGQQRHAGMLASQTADGDNQHVSLPTLQQHQQHRPQMMIKRRHLHEQRASATSTAPIQDYDASPHACYVRQRDGSSKSGQPQTRACCADQIATAATLLQRRRPNAPGGQMGVNVGAQANQQSSSCSCSWISLGSLSAGLVSPSDDVEATAAAISSDVDHRLALVVPPEHSCHQQQQHPLTLPSDTRCQKLLLGANRKRPHKKHGDNDDDQDQARPPRRHHSTRSSGGSTRSKFFLSSPSMQEITGGTYMQAAAASTSAAQYGDSLVTLPNHHKRSAVCVDAPPASAFKSLTDDERCVEFFNKQQQQPQLRQSSTSVSLQQTPRSPTSTFDGGRPASRPSRREAQTTKTTTGRDKDAHRVFDLSLCKCKTHDEGGSSAPAELEADNKAKRPHERRFEGTGGRKVDGGSGAQVPKLICKCCCQHAECIQYALSTKASKQQQQRQAQEQHSEQLTMTTSNIEVQEEKDENNNEKKNVMISVQGNKDDKTYEGAGAGQAAGTSGAHDSSQLEIVSRGQQGGEEASGLQVGPDCDSGRLCEVPFEMLPGSCSSEMVDDLVACARVPDDNLKQIDERSIKCHPEERELATDGTKKEQQENNDDDDDDGTVSQAIDGPAK